MATLLIVEDEAIVAQDLEQALTAMGHKVVGRAATGPEAIERAWATRPELLLMDVRLKGEMDGITASARLREKLPVPIIFLTAFADEKTLARAKEVEPYGYLVKPYSDRELRGAIEIALYKSAMEERQRQSARWSATALRSLSDAVIAVDVSGRIKLLNRAAEEMTGWAQPDALGQPLETVMKVQDARGTPAGSRPVDRALGENLVASAIRPALLERRNGGVTRIDECAAPIRDDAGEQLGAVVVFRDAAERGRLEEQLAISNRLSVMDTLTAGLAHEINNPLSCITSNLAFALEELAEVLPGLAQAPGADRLEETSRALADARAAADRVAQVVRDLKTMVRPSQRDYATLELAPVVTAAVRLCESEVKSRAQLKVSLQPVPPVRGSPGQLRQVVAQLLMNAAQAIPEGAKETNGIEVALFADPPSDAVIEVRDSGCGIPPEVMVRIFDPFFTTKPLSFGAGLGLSLCHAIVTSHGGDLSVTSRPGEGSIFRVRLPPAEPRPPPPEAEPRRGVQASRVLLLDDEPMVGDAIRRILEADRHEVVAVARAEDALERLSVDPGFAAVICDLTDSQENAMGFLEALARAAPRMARRMLLIGAGPLTEATKLALERGAQLLEKPFGPDSLRQALRRCLE